jgi:hypothetical protein
MSDVVNFTFIKRFIIAIIKIINLIIKLKLPTEFAEFIDVFNTKKAGVLTAHNKNKYTINLNRNKSFFGLLYNLLIKELKILRTYLNITLVKK